MSPEAFPLATRLGLARSPPPEGATSIESKGNRSTSKVWFTGLAARLLQIEVLAGSNAGLRVARKQATLVKQLMLPFSSL